MTDRATSILITRLSHIGDCVLTLPMVNALRRHLPHSRITWVVERPSDVLLAEHPAIDDLIVLRSGWLKRPKDVLALRRRLCELAPDICLDPQSLTKSSVIGWLAGAARRIGFARPVGRELAPWLQTHSLEPVAEHLVDRSIELLSPLGIHEPLVDFQLPEFADAARSMTGFRDAAHLGCGFAVINPGAGWASRRWPPKRYAAVARYLGQIYQLPSVVVWAGAEEAEMARAIIDRAGGHALSAPPTTLPDLVELLRPAKCYIGGDTGPMHLAAAVGIPCVTLHGPTLASRSGAYGDQHMVVQAFYQEADRRNSAAAMNAIEVERVCHACDGLMARLEQPRVGAHAA